MPQAMTLRAQDFTVLGVEATFGELGERFDMMDVEHDLLSAPATFRAVQLLLGHTKIESTARYLGIEVDDALAIAKQVEV